MNFLKETILLLCALLFIAGFFGNFVFVIFLIVRGNRAEARKRKIAHTTNSPYQPLSHSHASLQPQTQGEFHGV